MTERSVERSVQREDTTVRPVRERNGTSTGATVAPAAAPAAPAPPVIPPPLPTPAAPATEVTEVRAPEPTPTKPPRPSRSQRKALADSQSRPARRARLRLTRVDPWSVMKTSFLLSIAFGIVTIVSVIIVWSVLDGAGVWDSVNDAVRNVIGGDDAKNFDITDYLGTERVVGFTMIISVVDVVLLTAIATLAAFLYNMAAALLGGIEVTLAEDN